MIPVFLEHSEWRDLPTGGVCEFLGFDRTFELEMVVRGRQIVWFWQHAGRPFAVVSPAAA